MGDVVSFRRKVKWFVPSLSDDLCIQDWLGIECGECGGTGEARDDSFGRLACMHCGGTGEWYGFVCFAPHTMGVRIGIVTGRKSYR